MEYSKYGLDLSSDFEIRRVYEDEKDLDLFIAMNDRTVDMYLDGLPAYMDRRLQFNSVGNILIRISKLEDNSLATIHLLKSIDLQSSIINFVVDYRDLTFKIEETDYKNIIYIRTGEES